MMNFLLRMMSVTLLLVSLGFSVQAQDTAPYFTVTNCPFPVNDDTVQCGVMIVPENHDDPTSTPLRLAVMILPALSANPMPDPVLYLEGGPGYSALFRVNEWAQHPLRVSHDIILYDQRGTGFSTPSLNCPEVETGDYGNFSNPFAHCRYRIVDEEGIDITQYHSAASAADIDALRQALGYEQVTLYGISYGTRLALTVVRDYPDSVRALVLDSILPPEVDFIKDRMYNRMLAFDNLFDSCAADPTCNAAFPNLREVFYEVVERFNTNPYTFTDPRDPIPPTMDGNDVVDAFFRGMYRTEALPYLPFGIYTLYNAETERDHMMGYRAVLGHVTANSFDINYTPPQSITDLVEVRLYMQQVGNVEWAEGMNASVNCSEEIAFSDENAATDADAAIVPPVLLDYLVLDVRRAILWCASWDVPRRPQIETERITSDVPALLLGGAYDPITAVSWLMSASAGLPNSQTVIFNYGGHGVSYGNPCGESIVTSFVDAPHLRPDMSCATHPRLTFYTGR